MPVPPEDECMSPYFDGAPARQISCLWVLEQVNNHLLSPQTPAFLPSCLCTVLPVQFTGADWNWRDEKQAFASSLEG